jgi:RimJ/RimL family protein N-acetyltransferase
LNSYGQADDPVVAICHVTDPAGKLSICTSERESVVRHDKGAYYWHKIADRAGDWSIRWLWSDRLLAFPDQTVFFRVDSDVTIIKEFPTLVVDKDLVLVPLREEHIELVRQWRNRDDVRQMFFTQDIISEEQQRQWYFKTYMQDASDYMWIAFYQGRPVGTGALTHIDFDKKEAEWARLMIGETEVRGLGLASKIASAVRDYGLDTLKLKRIYGSLYTANRVTMHIDIGAGYNPTKEENGITHVELLRKDWRK